MPRSSRNHAARSPRASIVRWLAWLGLAALSVAPAVRAQPTPPETLPRTSFGEFGRLDARIRQVRRPNCWTVVVHGRIQNPYDEPVVGVRLVVRLRTAGNPPRELERIETEVSEAIGPGESLPFDRELSTACTNSTFNDVALVAFAKHRGTVELPTPTREVEVQASQAEEASAGPGSVGIVNSPVAIP
jgi:hypothetical protein